MQILALAGSFLYSEVLVTFGFELCCYLCNLSYIIFAKFFNKMYI